MFEGRQRSMHSASPPLEVYRVRRLDVEQQMRSWRNLNETRVETTVKDTYIFLEALVKIKSELSWLWWTELISRGQGEVLCLAYSNGAALLSAMTCRDPSSQMARLTWRMGTQQLKSHVN